MDFDFYSTHKDSSLFKLEPMPIMPYKEKDSDVLVSITVQMNLDIKQVYRLSYGVLDLISDIGGVYIFIFSLLAFILGMWNYNYVDNYMVSHLY